MKKYAKLVLCLLDIIVTSILLYLLLSNCMKFGIGALKSVCVPEHPFDNWNLQYWVQRIVIVIEILAMMYFLNKAKVKCFLMYFLITLCQVIIGIVLYFVVLKSYHFLNYMYHFGFHVNGMFWLWFLITGLINALLWKWIYEKLLEKSNKDLKIYGYINIVSVFTVFLANSMTYLIHYGAFW